jgi:hypothetical protein
VKVFLDACVLYPTVLREMLLGWAGEGLFRPLWSPRVLEEWARAARKVPGGEVVARGEIALLRAAWPGAEVTPGAATQARMWLPDPADVHVLAAASDAGADRLVTLNLRDFPRADVAAEGIVLQSPEIFALELMARDADAVARVAERVRAEAERLSEEPRPLRPLLKRARMPRLGKALG